MAEKLVPPARFEHAAYGLGNRRSIRLSYGGILGGVYAAGLRGSSGGVTLRAPPLATGLTP